VKNNCIYCGSNSKKVLYRSCLVKNIRDCDFSVTNHSRDFGEIVKCEKCGLIRQLYSEKWQEIIKRYKNLNILSYLSERKSREQTANRDAHEVKKYLKKGKILDIGCSAGIFLNELSQKFEKYGLEPGRASAKEALRLNPNAKVLNNTVEKVQFEKSFFDAVTLWDCIEHLKNPDKVLQQISKWLKPNGKIFICTPNIDSFVARLFGNKWPHLIRQHSFYFSPLTLQMLLEKNQFQVIKVKTYTRWFTLDYLIKRIFGFSISPNNWLKPLSIRVPINLGDTFLCIAKKNRNFPPRS